MLKYCSLQSCYSMSFTSTSNVLQSKASWAKLWESPLRQGGHDKSGAPPAEAGRSRTAHTSIGSSPREVELKGLPQRVVLQIPCQGDSLEVERMASLHQEVVIVLKLRTEVDQRGRLGVSLGKGVEMWGERPPASDNLLFT